MKKINFNFFKLLSIGTAILFAYLFLTLLLNSESFLAGLGLESSEASSFLAKRASMFMLGISVLMFGLRGLTQSKARQVICLATGITMLGLAFLGAYELSIGTVNSSILTAIIIEMILFVSFIIIIYMDRNTKITEG